MAVTAKGTASTAKIMLATKRGLMRLAVRSSSRSENMGMAEAPAFAVARLGSSTGVPHRGQDAAPSASFTPQWTQ